MGDLALGGARRMGKAAGFSDLQMVFLDIGTSWLLLLTQSNSKITSFSSFPMFPTFLETWEFTIFKWENLGFISRRRSDWRQEIAQDADGKDFQPEDSGAETVSGSTEGSTLRTDPCWLVWCQ